MLKPGARLLHGRLTLPFNPSPARCGHLYVHGVPQSRRNAAENRDGMSAADKGLSRRRRRMSAPQTNGSHLQTSLLKSQTGLSQRRKGG